MEESRKYETAKHIFSAAGFALNAGLLIYLWGSGWTIRLRDFAERIGSARSPSMVVLVYFAVLGVLFTVIRMPLSALSGYYLEHHFRLSRQSFRGWILDQLKGIVLGAVIGLAGVEIIYAFL